MLKEHVHSYFVQWAKQKGNAYPASNNVIWKELNEIAGKSNIEHSQVSIVPSTNATSQRVKVVYVASLAECKTVFRQ